VRYPVKSFERELVGTETPSGSRRQIRKAFGFAGRRPVVCPSSAGLSCLARVGITAGVIDSSFRRGEKKPQAPAGPGSLISHLISRWRAALANQTLETTSTAVTDRAGARSAPAAAVSHL
jgi:hypothetical protein